MVVLSLQTKGFSCLVIPCCLNSPLTVRFVEMAALILPDRSPDGSFPHCFSPRSPCPIVFYCLGKKGSFFPSLIVYSRFCLLKGDYTEVVTNSLRGKQTAGPGLQRHGRVIQGLINSLVLLSAKEVFPLPQNLSAVNWPVPPLFILISMKLCYL